MRKQTSRMHPPQVAWSERMSTTSCRLCLSQYTMVGAFKMGEIIPTGGGVRWDHSGSDDSCRGRGRSPSHLSQCES